MAQNLTGRPSSTCSNSGAGSTRPKRTAYSTLSAKPEGTLTMHRRLPLLLRAIAYGLRGGFLIRPFLIALLLALVAVGWFIFFIHHISQAISVNPIVDRIARETELVTDELMPRPRTRFEPMSRLAPDDTGHTAILNQRSGYVSFMTSISSCIWQNPGASAFGSNVAWASFFRPACRCCTSHVKTASIRCAQLTAGRVRYRADTHAATGRGVRRHPDRR